MTLAFLKYGLPVLLGYTLFVGVSGRLNPLVYPAHQEERASWLLGIWTGLGLCAALIVGLTQAYASTPTNTIPTLITANSLLALLLVPALGLYAYYRISKRKIRFIKSPASFNWGPLTEEPLQQSSVENRNTQTPSTSNTEQQLTDEQIAMQHEEPETAEPMLNVSPAYLKTAQINQMIAKSNAVAVNDTLVNRASGSDIRSIQPMHQHKPKSQVQSAKSKQKPATDTQRSLSDLNEQLASEVALREETEQHLRITRKALSVLEANTRDQENSEADSIIDLEEQLAQSIEKAADSETDATDQRARRVEVEQQLAELKQRMVKAKQEIRRSAAARAKALSTANQSIAFARQSVQIRTRLESELSDAQTAVSNRQKTISSLIRALEKEKRKTQSEIGSMARQMVLQEKQLKARRALEEVARSVENKLTSRLVKKVAKAKPLMSDLNQGDVS